MIGNLRKHVSAKSAKPLSTELIYLYCDAHINAAADRSSCNPQTELAMTHLCAKMFENKKMSLFTVFYCSDVFLADFTAYWSARVIVIIIFGASAPLLTS